MTTFISRDYNSAASGYSTQPYTGVSSSYLGRVHVNLIYQLSIFLHKILGYSVVGQTCWDINNTNIKSLAVTAATNTIPIQITTASAHGLIDGYVVSITGGTGNTGVNGTWKVSVLNPTQAILNGSIGNGTYNASSATMTSGFQYASGLVIDGYGASINSGTGSYIISIPIAKRTVVSGDTGKMLVLKSSRYPTKNSGIFKISSVDTGNNRYAIDYRSTEVPPSEIETIDWWLYESETVASNYLFKFVAYAQTIYSSTNTSPIIIQLGGGASMAHTLTTGMRVNISGHTTNTNANGNWTITQLTDYFRFSLDNSTGNGIGGNYGAVNLLGYNGGSAALNSRVILQSPHTSGWQVRIAAEPYGNNMPCVSITVGYGGNSSGDFPPNSVITNIAQYLDINPVVYTTYNNSMVGGGHQSTASRISIIGDDAGQSVFVYTKTLGGTNNGIMMFGIPNNEPAPTPTNSERLFCYGGASTSDFGTIRLRTGAATNVGSSIIGNHPEYCALTSWGNLDGTSATNPTLSANAGDCPFTGTTEILPVEIWGGINTDIALSNNPVYPFYYNQRFMGIAPLLRNGRTNFGDFTLSTENTASFTVSNASNASPIQITTLATNALTTGQTVTISGVTGNTTANGTFVVTVLDTSNFTLNGSVGNGEYISGGTGNGCPRWFHLQNGIYLQWNGAYGLTA